MDFPNFLAELKRRNVYKVAVAYAVAGWALSQGIAQVFPVFDIPNWAIRLIVLLIIIGLPIALALAWSFEITKEGIKRTAAADALPSSGGKKKHAWIYVVAIGAVFSIGLFLLGRYGFRQNNPAATDLPTKSIAVLPFDNLSEDKSNAFFAEGVQDEILTRLAKVADLKVISRTSTQHFKSSPDNLPQIAKQLGVMHILEGSVQKSNNQVRVNVQLINALTDAHLWAEMYDRKLTDIFTVESDIAKTIADTLQAKLTGSEQRALAARPTENQEAYQLYLQGRFFWNKRNAPDLRKAVDCFNQAIALDPKFAQAYAGLSQAWIVLPAYNGGSPEDCYSQAEVAAKKAVAIDENSVDALATMGSLAANYHFDIEGALKIYERVLQLNPNDATVHHWYGSEALAALGQHVGELAEMNHAAELDPLSLVIRTNLGNAYLHSGQLDEAISGFRKVIEMDHTFYFAQWCYGLTLEFQGKIPEAIAQYEKTLTLTDDPAVQGLLGHAYAVSGRKADAEKILAQLEEGRKKTWVSPYNIAVIRLGLGDRDGAVESLEQAFREHDGNDLLQIRIDPLLFPLHDNPRFVALAEKIVPARLFKSDVHK